eukprot:7392001-Prymnesium_polylepis.2
MPEVRGLCHIATFNADCRVARLQRFPFDSPGHVQSTTAGGKEDFAYVLLRQPPRREKSESRRSTGHEVWANLR